MKPFFLFSLILLSINIVNMSFTKTILFQHPTGVSEHYEMLAVPYEDNQVKRISHMTEETRKNLCEKSVDSVVFAAIPHWQKYDEGIKLLEIPEKQDLLAKVQSDIKSIRTLYDSFIIDPVQYFSVEVEFEPGGRRTKTLRGILCMVRPDILWLIEDGRSTSHFYVIAKNDTSNSSSISKYAKLLILAEEATTFINKGDANNSKKKMDADFRKSLLQLHGCSSFFVPNCISSAKYKETKNICSLNNFDRLRACSSAVMLWKPDSLNPTLNFVHEVEEAECLLINYEFTSSKTGWRKTSVQVDSIPCAVNGDRSRPQFYLTADQTEKGAVFILEARDVGEAAQDLGEGSQGANSSAQDEGHARLNKSKKYSVVMRVQNVLGLETL